MNDDKRDPETEEFINSLEGSEIYKFMRNEYDRLTEDGDNYEVEKHDAIVAQTTIEKFRISEQAAGDLYTSFEFKIAEFWGRRKKNK